MALSTSLLVPLTSDSQAGAWIFPDLAWAIGCLLLIGHGQQHRKS